MSCIRKNQFNFSYLFSTIVCVIELTYQVESDIYAIYTDCAMYRVTISQKTIHLIIVDMFIIPFKGLVFRSIILNVIGSRETFSDILS